MKLDESCHGTSLSTGSLVERNLSAQFHKDPCRPRNHGPAGVFRMFLGQKRRAHKLDEHTRAVIAGRSFLNKNSQRELAREYAVSTGTIANICSEFSKPPLKSQAIAAAEQYYRSNPRPAQPGACTTPVGSQASIPNLHSTYPRPFGDAAATGMSPATAAAGLAISGASAYTNQENVHFLAAAIALMSIPLPDHASTGLQATSRNLIAHSGKQDQPDRISRAREPPPSLSAAPRLNNEPSPRPNLSGHPITLDLELRIRHRVYRRRRTRIRKSVAGRRRRRAQCGETEMSEGAGSYDARARISVPPAPGAAKEGSEAT